MYEDDPQEKIFDVLGEAVFGTHPLGRAIIGRAPVIADTPVAAIRGFHQARYRPDNVVLSAAGAVEHDAFVRLAADRLAGLRPGQPGSGVETPSNTGPRQLFEVKDTEQYHFCLGGGGISRHDDRRFALRVLDNIFGGTSSSRLFQEVREKRGLAYAVYSFTSAYQDCGQVGLYLGTRGDSLEEAVSVIGEELRRLREEPATPEELKRAKENLKGRIVLSLESTGSRMNRLGSEVLAGAPLLSMEEVIERIEAVSHQDLQALADELWRADALSAAGIGPGRERFERALESLDPVAGGAAA